MAEYTDTGVGNPNKGLFAGSIVMPDQPIEERLRYDGTATSLHARILSKLVARRKLSERVMSRRYDSWQRADEHCRLFIDLNRKVKYADNSTDTERREIPWPRSIVVPMSYAIRQVYLTQLMGIYTRRDPPIEIYGVGPEDVKAAKLMNAVIAYDQVQTNYILELFTGLQDAMTYGMGGFHDYWLEDYGYKIDRASRWAEPILRMMGMPTKRRVWGKRREYNRVEAWDPYNFFPDPRISLSNIQNGEFWGHRLWRGYLEICAQSQDNGGPYFNTHQVRLLAPKPQAIRSRNRFQISQMNLIGSMDERDKGFHAIDSMLVNLIPAEWHLGTGDRPELWHFAWVDDQCIIRAHQSDYEHFQANYSAFESNIDTHVFGNQGSIENLDGLQRFMNWCWNSHIQNQIRWLNNRMVYDPSLIEEFDVENPDAALNVRLTALGQQVLREGKIGIQQMYQQMQMGDVTVGLVQSVNQMFDFAMRASGAADQMMGRTTSERRTLGEVQRVGHEGSARMAMHAGMMDFQGIRPTALRWASNRQQFTDEEQYVRITGDLIEEFGGDRVKVKPGDLYGSYDYLPKTGPEPPDPGELAQNFIQGLSMLSKSPEILAMPDKNGKVLDIHEWIKETLRQLGIKNVSEFYMAVGGQPGQQMPGTDVQIRPDEEVAREAERGNIIPMQQTAA
jgi:hypothetical protein